MRTYWVPPVTGIACARKPVGKGLISAAAGMVTMISMINAAVERTRPTAICWKKRGMVWLFIARRHNAVLRYTVRVNALVGQGQTSGCTQHRNGYGGVARRAAVLSRRSTMSRP